MGRYSPYRSSRTSWWPYWSLFGYGWPIALNSSSLLWYWHSIRYISRFVSIQSDGSFDRNRYSKVLAVVIESGAIYSTAILFEIIFYLMKSNVFYIVYDPFCQLTVSLLPPPPPPISLHIVLTELLCLLGHGADYDHRHVKSGSYGKWFAYGRVRNEKPIKIRHHGVPSRADA